MGDGLLFNMGKLIKTDYEVYLLSMAALLAPLHPLDIIVLSLSSSIQFLRHRSYIGIVILLLYLFLSTLYPVMAFLFISIYTVILAITTGKRLLSIGLLVSYAIEYNVIQEAQNLVEYYDALTRYFTTSNHEVVGAYTVLIPIAILHLSTGLMDSEESRIVKYFKENPQAYPALQFIVFLIYAAGLLAKGYEGLANKLAEMAYYSLVASVALALVASASSDDTERDSRSKRESGYKAVEPP